jgi:poly-gamma-glutamate capsule biosynthesis protein CapA/YwtB (metallophosphatase superfamily)
VHFEAEIRALLDEDPSSVFAPVAPLLASADLAMVNLETALTERGQAAAKEYTFRAPATAIEALRGGGVDVASMANNHGLDFGFEGLDDSLATAYFTGFPIIGIGHDEDEAYRPYQTVIKGQRITVIAATQVLDNELIESWSAGEGKPGLASAKRVERLVMAVEQARRASDTLVVFLHWGTERETCPNPQQQQLAQQLADAGADVIVGSHAHRVLAGGRLGNAVVNYGLGNFVFYGTAGTAKAESGVFRVTMTGRRVDGYAWHPARIERGVARPLTEDSAASALADWADRRSCTSLQP